MSGSPESSYIIQSGLHYAASFFSAGDPFLTRLLKDNVGILAPFLVELFNRCLSVGSVPTSFKAAYITPLLHYADDSADQKSYRPIANLSVLSKLLERLVVVSFSTTWLLPELQSAYSAHHSTETAVTKVLADILLALDTSDLSMLTLLDLSAPFDTVNHQILIRRLDILRPWQRRVDLVQVVPRQLYSIHPLWQIDINFGYSYFRSSTRVGPRTDSVPAIHSRPVATDRATQSTSTRIR